MCIKLIVAAIVKLHVLAKQYKCHLCDGFYCIAKWLFLVYRQLNLKLMKVTVIIDYCIFICAL